LKRIKPIPGSIPLFAPSSEWKPPNLSELPSWKNCRRASLDTEFSDPSLRKLGIGARRNAKICGFSFMLEGGKSFYVPIRHPNGNTDPVQALNYLRDSLSSFEGELLTANGNVDLDLLHYEDIRPDYDKVTVQDVQIRAPLINELEFQYNLEAIAGRYGFKGKDESELKNAAQSYGFDIKTAGWKAAIAQLPACYVGPYAERDAELLFPIYHKQQEEIDKLCIQEYVDIEAKLLPICLKMRQRGVRIDFNHLEYIEHWCAEEEKNAIAYVKDKTGWDIGFNNVMAASRLVPALSFIGITPPLTADGKPSIKADWLASFGDNPITKNIAYARKVNKIRTTFCDSVRRYQTNGRIHTTFVQVVGVSENNEKSGAAWGRLSSRNPNMQQQPSKGKLAALWRRIYLPDEGMHWCSSDLSAQEPRWAVGLAERLGLKGAKELGDQYRSNPRIDPHQATADICSIDRTSAKVVLLARLYGEGDSKLCHHQLKLPTRWLVRSDEGRKYFTDRKDALEYRSQLQGRCSIREVAGEEAQAIIDKFNAGAPFYGELARKAIEKADVTGYIRILGGRKLNFPMKKDGSFDHTYKALNRAIQGNSAVQVKLAIIAVEKEFPGFIQLTIHDEICGSVPDKQTAKDIGRLMENNTKISVPFRSDVDFGPNFGELQTLCLEKACLNFADVNNKQDKHSCPEHTVNAS
jgi:DNA polymerase I-like protein with 3'-5' exonuclease and polymerase domains